MNKSEVRNIASSEGLVTATKRDSTGICFIGERNFNEFLNNYLPAQSGDIKILDGETIGRHEGLMYYTLGQRKGLGIGGVGSGEPWFVVDKDIKNNILYVAQGADNPALFSYGLIASELHWVSNREKEKIFNCTAKFRYRQKDNDVTVYLLEANRCKVVFSQTTESYYTWTANSVL